MLSQVLGILGTATDVRSIAAIVLGVLTTVLGHNSVVVTGVVDGMAGLIVLVDTWQVHKTKQAKLAATKTVTTTTSSGPQDTVSTSSTTGPAAA